MSNPFAGVLLNSDGAIKPKPDVDVRPRRAEMMVTPFRSQIDAPASNYVAPEDIRPAAVEATARPCRSAIEAPGANHQQGDVEAKPLISEPGAKPVYLKLRDDDSEPSPPYQMYIPVGSNATDPTAILSAPICPIDGSKMHFIGSTRLAWVCEQFSHQFDIVGGMASVPAIFVADEKLRPALPNSIPSL